MELESDILELSCTEGRGGREGRGRRKLVVDDGDCVVRYFGENYRLVLKAVEEGGEEGGS